MTPTRWAAGLLLLLALIPNTAQGRGRGVTLSGFVGGGYLLSSDRLGSQSLFDFSGGFQADGGFLDPELLRWGLGATYLGSRGLGYRGTTAMNLIAFRARVTALSKTPLPVTLMASRSYGDASSQSTSSRTTGNSATTLLGGTATFHLPRRPTLTADLSRTMVDTEHPGGLKTFSGSTRFGAGISQGVSSFEYGANYETGWNDGTYSELNYRSHLLSARVSAPLAQDLKFNIYDSYYLRLPTTQSPDNPRFDTNQLGAGLQWLASTRLTGTFNYSHQQVLIAAPGSLAIDTRSQRMQQALQYKLLDSLSLRQFLAVDYAHAGLGTETRSGWGQSLGLGLSWQRPVSWLALSAALNGNVGLVEPDSGKLEVSYGGSAEGTIAGNFSGGSGSVVYNVSYGSGGPAVSGYTFQQLLRAQASARPFSRGTVGAFIHAVSARREDAFLGTFLHRAVSANAQVCWQQYLLQLGGGVTDGVDAALINPTFGGGLFLPSSYNTHSRFLQLHLASSFDAGRLGVRVIARLAETTAPNRPTEVGAGVTGSVWYTIGKFRISVEDRLQYGGVGAGNSLDNTLMVRLSRDFSGEFFQ